MKTPIEWYRELYQKGAGALAGTVEIAAIQADALDGLRDRFACAALTGLLACASSEARANYVNGYVGGQALAECAYTIADAMLARRATPTTTGAPAPQQPSAPSADTKGQ